MPDAETSAHSAGLARLSELLARRLGLHYPPSRWRDLARGVAAAAPELGCADAHACLERLLSGPPDVQALEALAQHMTVGETYFFRDPAAFAALRSRILPPLVASRAAGSRRLRLWSAGCSTGEEAYSIAITLAELLPDLARWNVSVLGTDVNARALARAREACYRPWSFRGTARELRERHFTACADGRLRLDERIRSLVGFAPLNLAEDLYPALDTNTNAMDVIFCRNVLMYLHTECIASVVGRLARCLVDGGWLVLSAVESSLVADASLVPLRLPDVLLFRKDAGARGEPARALAPAAPASRAPAPARASPPRPSVPAPAARPRPAEADEAEKASSLFAQGRYAEAAQALQALLDREPQRADAVLLLVRALANQGRLAEARAWCEKAIAADRLDPARSYLQASILAEQGELEDAAAAYRRTLYLDPERPLAHFALGNLLARQGLRAGALRHYRQALQLLRGLPPQHMVADAEGIAAGPLAEMIGSILDGEVCA